MSMDLNFTYDTRELPDFSSTDLENVLPGAALLEDIERYRVARRQLLHDQELVEKWVKQTAPRMANEILDASIHSLWEGDDGTTPDPHVALDALIARVDAIKADVDQRTNGPHAQKLERRFEALTEVYDGLKVRVANYTSNLSSNRALAVLLDDDDDDGQSSARVATPTPPAAT